MAGPTAAEQVIVNGEYLAKLVFAYFGGGCSEGLCRLVGLIPPETNMRHQQGTPAAVACPGKA